MGSCIRGAPSFPSPLLKCVFCIFVCVCAWQSLLLRRADGDQLVVCVLSEWMYACECLLVVVCRNGGPLPPASPQSKCPSSCPHLCSVADRPRGRRPRVFSCLVSSLSVSSRPVSSRLVSSKETTAGVDAPGEPSPRTASRNSCSFPLVLPQSPSGSPISEVLHSERVRARSPVGKVASRRRRRRAPEALYRASSCHHAWPVEGLRGCL